MARPKKRIDPELVKKLARIQCTHSEIASVCGVHESTIHRRFASRITKWRELGKISLRRWQFKAARSGNARVLIFLGKNILGQSDRLETTVQQRVNIIDWDELCGDQRDSLDPIEQTISDVGNNGQTKNHFLKGDNNHARS